MNDKCDKLEFCAFFNEFCGNTAAVKEAWIISFCDNYENSTKCIRKQYYEKHGVAPVVNMSPTGRLL